ncbi:unnamed protein product [Cylicocyclus nassatus]|uniref:Uncharacterized protein n=1 Tax=Cylicocyclus nassatus TaxID=53992 RepID=A0AA36DVH0_CYLNA|nr:unnamed protein product [Cylicocyclus nassatus]
MAQPLHHEAGNATGPATVTRLLLLSVYCQRPSNLLRKYENDSLHRSTQTFHRTALVQVKRPFFTEVRGFLARRVVQKRDQLRGHKSHPLKHSSFCYSTPTSNHKTRHASAW